MSISFKSFANLLEQQDGDSSEVNKAVFTFGRLNPPTKGHEKLINKVQQVAQQQGADSFIFPSQTTDKKKNPLPFDQKVYFLQQVFPNANIMHIQGIRTPHEVLDWLVQQGYQDITFVVGSDRVEEFQKRWLPYAQELVHKADIVSAGARDPDAEGISGMSATKARDAAKEGDVAKFRAATGWSGEVAEQMMRAVQQGLGVD